MHTQLTDNIAQLNKKKMIRNHLTKNIHVKKQVNSHQDCVFCNLKKKITEIMSSPYLHVIISVLIRINNCCVSLL